MMVDDKAEDPAVERLKQQLKELETLVKQQGPRREAEDVAREEMRKFIKQEIDISFKDLFSSRADDGIVWNDGGKGKGQEAMVDQMVAAALVRGKQTTNILKTLFNLLPDLAGR